MMFLKPSGIPSRSHGCFNTKIVSTTWMIWGYPVAWKKQGSFGPPSLRQRKLRAAKKGLPEASCHAMNCLDIFYKEH